MRMTSATAASRSSYFYAIKYVYFACLIVYLFVTNAKRVSSTGINHLDSSGIVNGGDDKPIQHIQVAKFNFEHVSDVYAITLWILLGSLAKIGFHLSHKLTEKLPESCLLIILGLVVGGIFYATKLAEQKSYVLNSDTFFLFLLPPIILEAGYFMPNRPFFDNIGTILLFAIANTLFNTICIGLTLWGFNFTPLYGGTEFEMLHCMVFAALISAVDPVAVLATFVEIQVNDMLYIVVFGESLLNDAVSVVLYRLFDSFSEIGGENIMVIDVVFGCTSFLVVAFGGVAIGIIFGLIASFTTKFTEHTPVLEPLIIVAYAYLSYLTAEMTSTSGILAITFCGMFMKQYVEFNITKKSNATIEYILKMVANIMETIIFMFMGLSTISDQHSWNTGFVIITIVCCTIYRFIGVFIFAYIANRWRLLELQLTDMLIMSYGGIRGAVAFALALILDEDKIPRKKEFVTATIAVVFFTVFLQGITIGPVVKFLKVKRKQIEEPTMNAKLTNRLIDYTMSALEDIAGVSGKHSLRYKVRNFDRKFLKPLLLREAYSRDEKLIQNFNKINEMNVSKMAENPNYGLKRPDDSKNDADEISMQSFGNEKKKNTTMKATRERRESFSSNQTKKIQKPKNLKLKRRDTVYHDLLEEAIAKHHNQRKRRPTIFNRSQLNNDDASVDLDFQPSPLPPSEFSKSRKSIAAIHHRPTTTITTNKRYSVALAHRTSSKRKESMNSRRASAAPKYIYGGSGGGEQNPAFEDSSSPPTVRSKKAKNKNVSAASPMMENSETKKTVNEMAPSEQQQQPKKLLDPSGLDLDVIVKF